MLNFLSSTRQSTGSNYVVYWWKRNNHLYPYSRRERVRQSARHSLIIIDGDSLSLSDRMAGWLLMLGKGGLLHVKRHWLLFTAYWANQGDCVDARCRVPPKTFVESGVKFGPVPVHSSSPPLQSNGFEIKLSVISALKHCRVKGQMSRCRTCLIFRLIRRHSYCKAKLLPFQYFFKFYFQVP